MCADCMLFNNAVGAKRSTRIVYYLDSSFIVAAYPSVQMFLSQSIVSIAEFLKISGYVYRISCHSERRGRRSHEIYKEFTCTSLFQKLPLHHQKLSGPLIPQKKIWPSAARINQPLIIKLAVAPRHACG